MAKTTSYARQQAHGISDPTSGATISPSNDHTDGSWGITDIYDRELLINTGNGKLQYRAGNEIYTLSPSSGDTGQTGSLTIDFTNQVGGISPAITLIPGLNNDYMDIAHYCGFYGADNSSYIRFANNNSGQGMSISNDNGIYPTTGDKVSSLSFIEDNLSFGCNDVTSGDQTLMDIGSNKFRVGPFGKVKGVVTIPAGGGTVTVNSTNIGAFVGETVIFLTPQSAITSDDFFYVDNIVTGSFDVTNINTLGGSVDVAWIIIN